MAEQTAEREGISRRGFLKIASGIAGVAVVGLPGLKATAQPIPPSVTLPKESLLEMYRKMLHIHLAEEKVREIVAEDLRKPVGLEGGKRIQPLYGFPWTHSSEGEEGVCAGVAMAMEEGDLLTNTHRSHGYASAAGIDLKSLMAELFGRATGVDKGHGGSMNIADPTRGVLDSSSVVGAGIPHAVGAAKAFKLLGKKNVAIATLGDGAVNTSDFNPSLNLAAIWELPVVFVINNNQYQITVKANWEHSLCRAGQDLSARAAGFAIPGITVDGMDVFAVYKAAKWAIDRARDGKGPALLDCVCYRYRSHGMTVAPHEVLREWPYNDPGEYNYWLSRDPIKRFENVVLGPAGSLTQEELDTVRQEVEAEASEAVAFAEQSPWPDPEAEYQYHRDVFGA